MKTVVLRLVGGSIEGQWVVVKDEPRVYRRPSRRELDSRAPVEVIDVRSTPMVATGSVEWNGDACAEVYVPADRLAYWRAEHEIEP